MVAYVWPAVPVATQVFTFLVFIGLAELVGLAGGASSRQATASRRRAGCGGRRPKNRNKEVSTAYGGTTASARVETPYDDKHSWKVARFQPPGWTFGLVWTILYAVIGVAATLVFLRFDANSGVWRAGLALWFVQLLFNGIWTPIYFGLYQPDWALVDLILTLLASAATTGLFWYEDLVSFILMCVYLAWLVFALVLNAVTVARSDHVVIARNRGRYFASMAAAY